MFAIIDTLDRLSVFLCCLAIFCLINICQFAMQSPSPDILTLSSLSLALIDMFFGKTVNTLWGDLGQFANIFRCMRENKWDAWLDKISREHRNICCCQEPNRKYNLIKHKTVKSKNRAINFSWSLLIQFRSLRGYWPRSGCQQKIRGMWGLGTITIFRVSRSPSLCVRHVSGQGMFMEWLLTRNVWWNNCRLRDRGIGGMGAGQKNQIGVFAPLWPQPRSRRRRDDVDWAIKLKSNSSQNFWPIRGKSGVSWPIRGQLCRGDGD